MFEIELFICIKMDLALNKLQWSICHKTQPTNNLSLGRGECSLSSISLLCFVYSQCYIMKEECHQISLAFIFQESFSCDSEVAFLQEVYVWNSCIFLSGIIYPTSPPQIEYDKKSFFKGESPGGELVNMLDFNIVVKVFELQSLRELIWGLWYSR